MRHVLRIGALILIAVNVFLAAWFFIHGDITFHTDIARDFLLLEDIAFNHNITLLGPRSGGIPGVFHGPLWLYINLPAYFIGQGSPIAVGWFWVLLFIGFLFSVYYVTKKMFGEESALLATLLTSVVLAESLHSAFNPFGAVILFPVFFYLTLKYINEGKFIQIISSLFVLGLIIQFQMAFGGPILVLIAPVLIYYIIRRKRYKDLLAFFILAIPLSTFLLFDLRHDFLQTKAILNYLSGGEVPGKMDTPIKELTYQRLKASFNDGLILITHGIAWALFFILYFFLQSFQQAFHKKDHQLRKIFLLFLYLYFGYWAVTILYKGIIWSYYYWPFIGVLGIFAVANYPKLNRKLYYVFFIALYLTLFGQLWNATIARGGYFGNDPSSWKFRRQIAEKVYNDAPAEFGYYIFTADQYGYPGRYAMNQVQRKFPNKKAVPFEKKNITYLFIDPSTNEFINDSSWKLHDVKIEKKADKIFDFPDNNIRTEKYSLTDEEAEVESNPNLLHTLIFR